MSRLFVRSLTRLRKMGSAKVHVGPFSGLSRPNSLREKFSRNFFGRIKMTRPLTSGLSKRDSFERTAKVTQSLYGHTSAGRLCFLSTTINPTELKQCSVVDISIRKEFPQRWSIKYLWNREAISEICIQFYFVGRCKIKYPQSDDTKWTKTSNVSLVEFFCVYELIEVKS